MTPRFKWLLLLWLPAALECALCPGATVSWVGGSGDWNTTNNWSTGALPGINDDVVIGSGTSITVTHSSGSHTVHSILSQQPFTLSGGSLTVSNTAQINSTFTLSGGALVGATVLQPTNNSSLIVKVGGTLNGVTVNGVLDVGSTYTTVNLTVTNGLVLNGTAQVGNPTNQDYGAITFAGSQTLGGSGTVVFGNNASPPANALRLLNTATTLTIGPGITVRGQSGTIGHSSIWAGPQTISVVNQGTIQADVSGGTISLTPQTFTNQGTVGALYGIVTANSGFVTSAGMLSVGLGSSNNYGQIKISGSAAFGGTLNVALLGGFVPAISNSFTVITYGSFSGSFITVNLPIAPLWQTTYGTTALSLLVTDINKLVMTAKPTGTNAGAIFTPVVVQVEDAATSSPMATNGVPVMIALNSGSGTLSGTLTKNTDSTGKATFNDLSINLVGVKTLQASASAAQMTPTTSPAFTITPGPAAQLALVKATASPQPSATAFSPAPVVQVLDQFGNALTNSTASITARLGSGGGGSLAGTTSVGVSGSGSSAAFSNLYYNLANPRTDESVVVYFTSPGLSSVTNSLVTVDFVGLVTLTNRNSVVEIDPTTEQGMFSWIVDGTNEMYQHWFWLRQGSSGPQASFDRLGTPFGLSNTATNASILFLPPGLNVNLGFALTGGPPGSLASDIVEAVMIQNTNNSSVTLHIFDYMDVDLAGASQGDTVSFPNTNSVLQQGKGMALTQTVQGLTPNSWEASWYSITLDELQGTSPVTLSDDFITAAPGDQTFAYQWDITLAPGQTFTMNLTNSIRAEPISLGSLSIALQGGNVIISWPTNSLAGVQLQTTSVLGAAASWTAVTNSLVIMNGQNQVSVLPAGMAQFYQLEK